LSHCVWFDQTVAVFFKDYSLPNPAQALMLNNALIRYRKSHFACCHVDLFSCLYSWYIAFPASTKLSAYGCICQKAFEFFGNKIPAHRFCYSRLGLKNITKTYTDKHTDGWKAMSKTCNDAFQQWAGNLLFGPKMWLWFYFLFDVVISPKH